MSAAGVFEAKLDLVRNIARVRFAGDFTAPAMAAAAREVESLLPQLRPGFAIFADLSAVQSMEVETVQPLTRIMDLCRSAGIGLIVRILPPPERDIGINMLSIIHYRGKVKTLTVDTVEEAERALPSAKR